MSRNTKVFNCTEDDARWGVFALEDATFALVFDSGDSRRVVLLPSDMGGAFAGSVAEATEISQVSVRCKTGEIHYQWSPNPDLQKVTLKDLL